ncbi:hypothetical protein Pint_18080 [Pistacia integerrima]|uniref:Uncharacterized protein n=1 Tax=Pistacia integerrima TaxID=434235 RepID=A0ACC0YZR7_9ROSI|nr:hypothetical protein Pint_18080 [Pistacia integerrima]
MPLQLPTRLIKCFSLSSLPATSTLQELASSQPKGVPKVVLKKGKTQLFKDGSPMVYSGAVDRIIGRPPPRTGDVVLVADGTEKPIAWGLYNSVSMFCVRLMQLEEEAARDPSCALNMEKLIETRIDAAIKLRKRLGLPSANTNAYRLVNSEGDRSVKLSMINAIELFMIFIIFSILHQIVHVKITDFFPCRLSGLIVDVFGESAVIASSAAWVEKYKPEIEAFISRIDDINHIKWRPSFEILKEEGLDVSDLKEMCPSTCPERTKVLENGISYAISMEGQKTGFYADQRENRHLISTISNGKRVLDICCYSGGFSLNAVRGGAIYVTGIVIPLRSFINQVSIPHCPLWSLLEENIVLNNLDPERITFLREDATEFMKGALSRKELWDIVILDPPKLAPRRKGAASVAGRKITVVRQAGAACDHPVDPSYPEGAYLSNILLRVL